VILPISQSNMNLNVTKNEKKKSKVFHDHDSHISPSPTSTFFARSCTGKMTQSLTPLAKCALLETTHWLTSRGWKQTQRTTSLWPPSIPLAPDRSQPPSTTPQRNRVSASPEEPWHSCSILSAVSFLLLTLDSDNRALMRSGSQCLTPAVNLESIKVPLKLKKYYQTHTHTQANGDVLN